MTIQTPTQYAKLYIAVDMNHLNLYEKYEESIQRHNNSVWNNPYPNAGFDLFFPEERVIPLLDSEFVSMGVKCEMHLFDEKLKGLPGPCLQLFKGDMAPREPRGATRHSSGHL